MTSPNWSDVFQRMSSWPVGSLGFMLTSVWYSTADRPCLSSLWKRICMRPKVHISLPVTFLFGIDWVVLVPGVTVAIIPIP